MPIRVHAKVYGGIVTSLALACDDQILVVGSVDSTVSLWLVKYPSTKTNLDNIREVYAITSR